jgi:hypothetical protein
MPTQLTCRECGYLLMSDPTLPSIDWYVNLYGKLDGKCPSCRRSLPLPSRFKDTAKIIEVKINPAAARLDACVSSFRHDYHKRGR